MVIKVELVVVDVNKITTPPIAASFVNLTTTLLVIPTVSLFHFFNPKKSFRFHEFPLKAHIYVTDCIQETRFVSGTTTLQVVIYTVSQHHNTLVQITELENVWTTGLENSVIN